MWIKYEIISQSWSSLQSTSKEDELKNISNLNILTEEISNMKVLLIAVVLFVCYMHIKQISADHLVTYYEHVYFGGASDTVKLKSGRCFNLNSKFFYNSISSINTNGACVILFKDQNCSGESITVKPGSNGDNNLDVLHFNDKTSSMKLC